MMRERLTIPNISSSESQIEFMDGLAWWVRQGSFITVGVSLGAIDQVGELESIELPESGDTMSEGDALFTLEGTLASLEIESPFDGVVVSVTPHSQDLDAIRDDLLDEGWLVRLKVE